MLNNSDKNNDLTSLLEDIKLDLLDYINKRVRLFKLDAFEKTSITSSALGYGFIVFSIIGIMLFFTLFGLAFFLGEVLESNAAGFGVLALFSLLVLIIIILCRKPIKRSILNKTIVFLQKVDENEAE